MLAAVNMKHSGGEVDMLLSVSLDLPKDELQTAIELSLQESHSAREEEKEFNRYKETCFLCGLLMYHGLSWRK